MYPINKSIPNVRPVVGAAAPREEQHHDIKMVYDLTGIHGTHT